MVKLGVVLAQKGGVILLCISMVHQGKKDRDKGSWVCIYGSKGYKTDITCSADLGSF